MREKIEAFERGKTRRNILLLFIFVVLDFFFMLTYRIVGIDSLSILLFKKIIAVQILIFLLLWFIPFVILVTLKVKRWQDIYK